MSTPNAEVLDRTHEMPRMQVDSLPEELVEWAAENGNTVGWSSQLAVSFLQGYNRYPLLFSEIPTEVQKAVRKAGIRVIDDELRKFDCLVTVQPLIEQQRFRDMEEHQLRMQEEDRFDGVPEAVQQVEREINAKASAATGKSQSFATVSLKQGGSAREHVVGGPALKAIIEREESESEGRANTKK